MKADRARLLVAIEALERSAVTDHRCERCGPLEAEVWLVTGPEGTFCWPCKNLIKLWLTNPHSSKAKPRVP